MFRHSLSKLQVGLGRVYFIYPVRVLGLYFWPGSIQVNKIVSSGLFGSKYLPKMLGSPKRDPVRFGFLKTQEPRVKFRVGFGPDPALGTRYVVHT